jgi:dipeptidyl aminopeptidase/acylaminoacyl peptidase
MRCLALLALIVPLSVLAPNTWAADSPAPAASPRRPSIQQFLKIRAPGAPVVLTDGSLLLRDWPDGIRQLYRVLPKSAGEGSGAGPSYRTGEATFVKLTDFPDGLSSFSVSPDDRRVVLMHARGGDENTQLTLLDLAGTPAPSMTSLLSNPKAQASLNVWLKDGSGFVYSANDESPEDFYLYRYDFASGKPAKLLGEKGAWSAADITHDGRRVLVEKSISASDVRCYELDAATGRLRDLTIRPDSGTAGGGIVGYLPDERRVLIQSDIGDGRQRLYLRDLASGKVRDAIPELGRFELDAARINDTRELLVAVTNEDGYGVPHVYALPDFRPLPAPTGERGVISPASFRGRTLVWSLNSAREPGIAFATTYPAPGRAPAPPVTRRLTWTDDQGIDLGRFPLPELVKYRSFDGREIPAFVYVPPGYGKGTPIPFVVNYHGGPEDQTRPGFGAFTQYLLTRGFGVMQPNVRGSTGYGREFQMLDDYTKRWDSVRDGVEAAEWLVANGFAAPGMIATYGGSYGGFMSVACLVEDQDRVDRGARQERLFGACVDVVGIVNMRTFLEKTSGYRRKLREAEYGPLTDTLFLASVSSIHRVDRIRVPVFIGHGFNDPRVPVEEAMQLAVGLKDRGMRPRLFIAPDEGHGFAKLDNRIYFLERAASFLEETIGSPRPREQGR